MSAPTIDNTLGAALLGNLVAGILYGVTCVQTFLYFQNYTGDRLWLKFTVLSLWMCDTVILALVTRGVYFYAVTNFSNPAALLDPTITILVHIIITAFSDLVVRYVFGQRLWNLSDGNILLTIAIASASLVVFVSATCFTILAIGLKTFTNFSKLSYLIYLALGTAVVADVLIASSLCIVLAKSRTGFTKTDSLINVLMMYTINTGVITSMCAALCFILYATMPYNYVYLAVYFNLSKFYFNSLLATLNARATHREKSEGLSTVQLSGVTQLRGSGKMMTKPIAINTQSYTERKSSSSTKLGSGDIL